MSAMIAYYQLVAWGESVSKGKTSHQDHGNNGESMAGSWGNDGRKKKEVCLVEKLRM